MPYMNNMLNQLPPSTSLSRNASQDNKFKSIDPRSPSISSVRSREASDAHGDNGPLLLNSVGRINSGSLRSTVDSHADNNLILLNNVGRINSGNITTSTSNNVLHKCHSLGAIHTDHNLDTMHSVNNNLDQLSQDNMLHSHVTYGSQSTLYFNSLDISEPIIDDVVIQCSVAISSLAQVLQCQSALVSGGVLPLLASWISDCCEVLKYFNEPNNESVVTITSNQSPTKIRDIPKDHAVFSLITNTCSTLASLTGLDKISSSVTRGLSGSALTRVDAYDASAGNITNYTIGWIDAQVLRYCVKCSELS
jgi:hypothetical protein